MNRQASTTRRRTTAKSARSISNSGSKNIDRYLTQILTSVAQLLLRNGYGFRRFDKLARLAFVEAAMALDSRSSVRTTVARIAAVTGLTRIEVSQLRKSKLSDLLQLIAPSNRAIGVATGWASDERYLGTNNQPKQLAFISAGASFTKLVREYSGDIPARAMLFEMKRLGMVKESSEGSVKLVRDQFRPAKSTIAAMRAISPWIEFFGKSGDGRANEELTSTARQLKIHFDSLPQVYAAVREVEERRTSFIAGLELLGTRSKKDATYDLTISIAVAAEKPLVTRRLRR
jgi:hypothetical protein